MRKKRNIHIPKFPNEQLLQETDISHIKSEELYENCIFKNGTISGEMFEQIVFKHCQFVNVTFEDIQLYQLEFINVRFENCNISNSEMIGAIIHQTRFSDYITAWCQLC